MENFENNQKPKTSDEIFCDYIDLLLPEYKRRLELYRKGELDGSRLSGWWTGEEYERMMREMEEADERDGVRYGAWLSNIIWEEDDLPEDFEEDILGTDNFRTEK